jgi:hypothetical protein
VVCPRTVFDKCSLNSRHVEQHSSPLANVTVTQLGFYAWPFHMERDTLINRAAAKVSAAVRKDDACGANACTEPQA